MFRDRLLRESDLGNKFNVRDIIIKIKPFQISDLFIVENLSKPQSDS